MRSVTTENPPADRFELGSQLGYSAGNLGKSVVWATFDNFLLYYLVMIGGFSPLLVGAVLTLTLLWDGCADIAVAYLADRFGRQDALGRLILIGAPLCGIGFWLTFAAWPDDARIGVLGAVVMCRIGYTLCDIGHNTLLVRVAVDHRAAASVSGQRFIFSSIGTGIVGIGAAANLSQAGSATPGGFVHWAMAGGALYIATLWIAMIAARRLRAPRDLGPGRPSPALFHALWGNGAYRRVILLIVIQAGSVAMIFRALPFLGEAMHGSATWGGSALTTITIAQALSLPGWIGLSRRWRADRIIAIAYAIMLPALVLLALPFGQGIEVPALLLLGTAQAGVNMAIWALLTIAIQSSGPVDGARYEALPVGIFLAALKASAAMGGGLLSVLLAASRRWCGPCWAAHAGIVPVLIVILSFSGALACLAIILLPRLRSHRRMAKRRGESNS